MGRNRRQIGQLRSNSNRLWRTDGADPRRRRADRPRTGGDAAQRQSRDPAGAQQPVTAAPHQNSDQPSADLRAAAGSAETEAKLNASLTSAWQALQGRAAEVSFQHLLSQVFGSTSGDATTFTAAAAELSRRLAAGDQLGLHVTTLSGAVMGSAAGAYAASGAGAAATIYVNGDWLAEATPEQVQQVLLEEISHHFDTLLNGGLDTAGDEGERFAALFSGIALSEAQLTAIAAEDDHGTLLINGSPVAVEFDNVTSISAVSLSSDTGLSSTDRITRAATQTITATTATNNSGSNTPVLWISANGGTTRVQGTISGWSDNSGAATFSFTNVSLQAGSGSLSFYTVATGGTALGSSFGYSLDTGAPTLTISSDRSSLKAGDTATITFSFSEDPGSSFSWNGSTGDITLSGGTLSALSGSGTTRSATFTPTAATNSGSASITVAAGSYTDAAGNSGGAGSSPSISFDTLAPTTSVLSAGLSVDTGSSGSDFITSTATQTISGSLSAALQAGETVVVSLNNGSSWQSANATVGQTGWSLPGVTLTSNNTLLARVSDAAGNNGPVFAQAYQLDTAAPAAPVLTLAAGVSTGATAAEATAASGVLSLTAEAGTSVAIVFSRSGGGSINRSVAGNGSTPVAITLSTADLASLGDGAITVSAIASDAAGNTSATAASSFSLDTAAPAALGLTPPADTGVNSSDGITSSNTFSISGLESGAGWQFSSDGGSSWSAGSGSSFNLADGSYAAGRIQVRQIDAAGNVGTISATASAITIDSTAPVVQTITPAAASSSIALNSGIVIAFSEAIYANGGTIAIQSGPGSGSNSDVFRMTLSTGSSNGGFTPGTGLGSGSWSIAGNRLYIKPNALAAGTTYNIDISATALVSATGAAYAGITSTQNTGYRFTTAATGSAGATDSSGPSCTITALAFSADTAGVGTSGTTADFITRTAAQTISGTLSAALADDELVQVSLDNGSTWRFADASAGVSFLLSGVVLSGSNTLRARVIDAAGNGGAERAQAYVLDTAAAAPQLSLQADTGSSGRDGITSNGTVLISQLESGGAWELSIDGGSSWSAGSGSSFSLGEGSYAAGQVRVRQLDAAGNASAAGSNGRAWIVDTTTPQFLAGGSTALTPILENSGAGQQIYAPQMAATEGVTGGLLRYSLGPAADGGSFSVGTFSGAVTLVANPDHELKPAYSFSLIATDVAGNSASQSVTLTVLDADEIAPDAPQIAVVAGDDRLNGQEAAAGLTVSGSAEAGSMVSVRWGDNPVRTTIAAGGSWSVGFAAGEIPANGIQAITATASDTAGNTSSAGSRLVQIDRIAPNRPLLDPVSGDDRIAEGEKAAGITLGGSGEAGGSIELNLAGSSHNTTIGSDGRWSLTIAAGDLPADGWAELSLTCSDAAGNRSSAVSRLLLIDSLAPLAPTLQAIAGDDRINAVEAAGGIQLSGTAEAGTRIEAIWDGSSVGSCNTSLEGRWSIVVPAAALPGDGWCSLLLRASDAAGNSSSLSRDLQIDRQGPAAPTVAAIGSSGVINAAAAAAGLTLSGTAESGSRIELQWGSLSRSTSTGVNGRWSLSTSAAQLPADGLTNLSVTAIDAVGNVSATTTTTVLIDTTASRTGVSSLQLSADSGSSSSDFVTAQSEQVLSGSLTAPLQSGERVEVSVDGGLNWSPAGATPDGLSFSAPISLVAPAGTLAVRVVDGAGNGGAVRSQAYRLLSGTPANSVTDLVLSSDTGISGDRITAIGLQTISGVLMTPLQAGERVQFRRLQADGSWSGWANASSATNSSSFSFTTNLQDGSNTLESRFVDLAGNASAGRSLTAKLDRQAPAITAIDLDGAGRMRPWQAGDVVTIQLSFSESVRLSGTPSLTLQIGQATLAAPATALSDRLLSFSASLDAASLAGIQQGISLTAGSLNLSSGTISDAAGNQTLASLRPHHFGSGGTDTLSGGAEADVIIGGSGGDVISGGAGGDRFVLRSSTDSRLGSDSNSFDHITDFQLGIDQLQLADAPPISTFTDLGSTGTAELTASTINSLLTASTFSTAGFAARFSVGANTFLAINDGTPGFSALDDALILIGTQAATAF